MRLRQAGLTTAIAGLVTVGAMAAGTALSVTWDTVTVSCPNGDVSAPYTIATTAGEAATVVETLTLEDTVVTSKQYIVPSGNVTTGGGWVFAGRTKTRDGVFTTSGLQNGTYELEVCATQAGSAGNPNKKTCAVETIIVNCGAVLPTPCTAAPFGEAVGNNHIGSQAAAELQFRGDFGSSALVTVTGNGFSDSASINQNGNSCTYHANWKFQNANGADLFGANGPGAYLVNVTGNGKSLDFVVTLVD